MNKIYRATTKNQEVRAFVAETKDLIEEAHEIHQTNQVGSAALGRLLTAGAMMSVMLKGKKDTLTLNIKGDGPLSNIIVSANANYQVKGYISHPRVDIPRKDNGKIDVSGAIGKGTLTVVKDLGLKEPYGGHIELVSGEIADDLTYYFAASEQTPSVVALGVLVDRDYTIRQAGGFIIQLLPGASEETISQIEKNIHSIGSVTELFEFGLNGKGIMAQILKGFEYTIHDTLVPEYKCDCSMDRMERGLISIGKKDLQELINEGEPVEMNCHFCNSSYTIDIDRLNQLKEAL